MRIRVAGIGLLSLAMLAPAALAQASPEKSAATVKATWELVGGGSFTPNDKSYKRDWTTKDTYAVTATMKAQKPGGWPAMHAKDAALEKGDATRMAAATQATTDASSMMARAEKIMEMCQDDEACIQRESMKLAQGMTASDKQNMANAKKNIDVATQMPATRYQLFGDTQQTGSYTIAENVKIADRDPICIGMPQNTCHISITTVGNGAIAIEGKTTVGSGAMAELDMQANSLRLTLPLPYPVKARETVVSDKKGDKSGTTDVQRFLTNLKLDLNVAQSCSAPCKTVKGEKIYDVEDQYGMKAKLKVTWTFERK